MDDNSNETFEEEAQSEMVYRGENVTLGYATCRDDLLKGDENQGIMHIFHQKIEIQVVDQILRNEAGKVINQ